MCTKPGTFVKPSKLEDDSNNEEILRTTARNLSRLGWDKKALDNQYATATIASLERRGVIPNLRVYGHIVRGLAVTQDFENAHNWIDEMEKKGLKPDSFTYNSLISAYLVSENVEKALEMIEIMKKKEVALDSYTFCFMIDWYWKAADSSSVKKWIEMFQKSGIKPNLWTYSMLIKRFSEAGDIENTLYWIEDLKKRGETPNFATTLGVAYAYIKIKKMDEAEELFRELERGKKVLFIDSYIALINGFRNVGNNEKSQIWVNKMRSRKHKLSRPI